MLEGTGKRSKPFDPAWAWSIKLWLGSGAAFLLWVLLVTMLFPSQNTIPQSNDYQPGNVFEYALLHNVLRYDVDWYINIARNGYGHRVGDTGFHPLLPLLMGILGRILGGSTSSYLIAGMLIASISTLFLLLLFYRLLELDTSPAHAHYASFLLISSPLAWVLFVPYTESLLLVLSIAALYAARKGRWWLAGLAGACATLTKQPGAFLIAALLWELWKQQRGMRPAQRFQALLGIMLIPAGLLLWIVYRATLGDLPIQWENPSSVIRALMISPSVNKEWEVAFGWPWLTLQSVIQQYQTRPGLFLALNMIMAAGMIIITLMVLPRLRGSMLVYTLILFAATIMIVQTRQPYAGIGRRFLIIFPVYSGLAALLIHFRYRYLMAGLAGGALWLVTSFLFLQNGFLP